jgi:hypothetical protein
MALKDNEACRIAAEEALKAAGVREDMLDRAVRAVGLQPGDDLSRARIEVADLQRKLPSLFGAAPASPARKQTGQAVTRARETARADGWDAVASAAAAAAGAQARQRSKSNVAKGRERAVELGWTKP